MRISRLTNKELYELFELKYGHPDTTGWSPRRRLKWGYYQPGDIYEAMVRKVITSSTTWIDVGGGRALFPSNDRLSRLLAAKCAELVAIDPSENVYENPYAHKKILSMFEDFQTEEKFNLATFRMVAEHITNPEAVLKKLSALLEPNGIVIIYTINKFSPIPMLTKLTPFSWHFKIKKLFWSGEERDTFPIAYKMNTRKDLKKLFTAYGFEEIYFEYLDDLSAFSGFKSLNIIELITWRIFRKFHIRYPENNLLGVYQRKS